MLLPLLLGCSSPPADNAAAVSEPVAQPLPETEPAKAALTITELKGYKLGASTDVLKETRGFTCRPGTYPNFTSCVHDSNNAVGFDFTLDFYKDVLGSIQYLFYTPTTEGNAAENLQAVKAALIEKYGPPTSDSYGATAWQASNSYLLLFDGSVSLTSSEYQAGEAAEKANATKAITDGL